METSSLPMTGLKYWRIFDTHGLWALISNTELSSFPRSCLFKELKNWKKHPMIKEQSCHQNTHVENTILFKKPRFNARWYSILFYSISKNKQDPNFTTVEYRPASCKCKKIVVPKLYTFEVFVLKKCIIYIWFLGSGYRIWTLH